MVFVFCVAHIHYVHIRLLAKPEGLHGSKERSPSQTVLDTVRVAESLGIRGSSLKRVLVLVELVADAWSPFIPGLEVCVLCVYIYVCTLCACVCDAC